DTAADHGTLFGDGGDQALCLFDPIGGRNGVVVEEGDPAACCTRKSLVPGKRDAGLVQIDQIKVLSITDETGDRPGLQFGRCAVDDEDARRADAPLVKGIETFREILGAIMSAYRNRQLPLRHYNRPPPTAADRWLESDT